jgi:serine/threonine protein kinase
VKTCGELLKYPESYKLIKIFTFFLLLASMKLPDGEVIDVAVKAPKINLLTGTSAAIDDFYKEAKTTLFFNHENVVKCLGFSKELDELPCLLFEYMSYGSLEVVLASNRTKNFQQQIKLTNVSSYFIYK